MVMTKAKKIVLAVLNTVQAVLTAITETVIKMDIMMVTTAIVMTTVITIEVSFL